MIVEPIPKSTAPRLPSKRAEDAYRKVVVQEVMSRDRSECQGRHRVPSVECSNWGWTAHEVVQRSVRKNSHLEPDLCVWICGTHHDWVHNNIAAARELGLIRDSHEVNEDGTLKPLAGPSLWVKETQ